MAFSGKADLINWSASLNSVAVYVLGLQLVLKLHSIAPKPHNSMDQRWVNWGPLTIGSEVTAIWLGEIQTCKGKNNKYF